MTIVMSLLCVFFFAVCVFLVKKNLEMLNVIDDLDDAIEECLDTLTKKHASILRASQNEVFYDDPVVKSLVKDIKDSRDAVSAIINVLRGITDTEGHEDKA